MWNEPWFVSLFVKVRENGKGIVSIPLLLYTRALTTVLMDYADIISFFPSRNSGFASALRSVALLLAELKNLHIRLRYTSRKDDIYLNIRAR